MKCWPSLREISPPNRPQQGSVAVEEDCTEIKSNGISWILLNSSILFEIACPVKASFTTQLQQL